MAGAADYQVQVVYHDGYTALALARLATAAAGFGAADRVAERTCDLLHRRLEIAGLRSVQLEVRSIGTEVISLSARDKLRPNVEAFAREVSRLKVVGAPELQQWRDVRSRRGLNVGKRSCPNRSSTLRWIAGPHVTGFN
jgi:hypothetical protein